MKILMTTDNVGGVWTYSLELCAALARQNVSIALATMGLPLSDAQRQQLALLPHVHVYESHYRLCWMPDAAADLEAAGEWLLALERELQPDLVHLNDLGHGALAWQSPVILVAHSCVYSWFEAVKGGTPASDWQAYFARVSAGVQRADLVVAPTRAMLERFMHFYGDARHSMVIANGRSPRSPNEGGSPVVNDDNSPIVFAAGRLWDDAKNIAALVAIAEQLPGRVYIAGECSQPGGDTEFDSSSCPGNLHCLGFLDERAMQRWLQRADIYGAPAFYEPFGLGILEAARAGCALVLSDIPSLREIWRDSAVYVDPNDRGELREAISALYADAKRRKRLAQRAWQRSLIYSSTRMASHYAECYRRLLRKRQGGVAGFAGASSN